MIWWILHIFLLPFSEARTDCSRKEYDKCIRIADPLVKEAHLVFPDNVADIDQVCTIWNQFVDCLKLYTDDCFTDQQRRQFNRAVESPIESVHQMCMQPSYQKEYLQYASCIKNTIVQKINCGLQYSLLVDQVEQGDVISKSTLCCSHDRFKQCVQRETRRLCDRGISDGPATKFATQIIDKALSFLRDQCLNYIPNSGDCQIHPTDNLPFSDLSDNGQSISTAASEDSSRSTMRETISIQKEISINELPPKGPPYNWRQTSPSSMTPTSEFPTQMLGSRSRPASYGRSSHWPDNNQGVAGNTVQMYPEISSTATSKPNWSPSSWENRAPSSTIDTPRSSERTFSTYWNQPELTSETWYPAAGNQLNNEVDEPNQLGLTKPKNNSSFRIKSSLFSLFVFTIVVLFC